MIINFESFRSDELLTIIKQNDTIIINNTSYDLTQLPEGATLPRKAIDCKWIVSDVNRVNGEIELTILLPHGANASHEARFPEPIVKNDDGQVVLPI